MRRAKRKTSKPRPVPANPLRVNVAKLSPSKLLALLVRQQGRAKAEKLAKAANKAVTKFRPGKKDRGNLVFVSTTGKRNPQTKGRKGYLVWVSGTGKKYLIPPKSFTAKKITEINIPIQKRLRKATKKFTATTLEQTGKTRRAVVKGSGRVTPTGRVNDFDEKVVSTIARSIQRTINAQQSRRVFLIETNVLVELPDKTTRAYFIQIPIAKQDRDSIQLGGIENFVRQKFYAFLAKQLEFDGFVTRGSANHVRKLAENKGVPKSQWTKKGIAWNGRHDSVTVKILQIEWRILQQKLK